MTAPQVKIEHVCTAEARAPIIPEPLPPEGVDANLVAAALVDYLGEKKGEETWEWLLTVYRPWAKENAARVKAQHDACLN